MIVNVWKNTIKEKQRKEKRREEKRREEKKRAAAQTYPRKTWKMAYFVFDATFLLKIFMFSAAATKF